MILLRSRENLIFGNMHFLVTKAFVLLHIIPLYYMLNPIYNLFKCYHKERKV